MFKYSIVSNYLCANLLISFNCSTYFILTVAVRIYVPCKLYLIYIYVYIYIYKGVSGQQHAPAALYPQERPCTHCTGGWVGPRAGLDGRKISSPTGIRSPDRPARSQSLYRLRYPTYIYIFFLWRCDPTRVMASSFLRFLDHTQRRITVGRTPLDKWSARRRDLYLTKHDTHNRQISMPRWNSNPRSQQASGRRPTP